MVLEQEVVADQLLATMNIYTSIYQKIINRGMSNNE